MVSVPHNMPVFNLSIYLVMTVFKYDILFTVLNSALPNVAANELFQTKYCEGYT